MHELVRKVHLIRLFLENSLEDQYAYSDFSAEDKLPNLGNEVLVPKIQ